MWSRGALHGSRVEQGAWAFYKASSLFQWYCGGALVKGCLSVELLLLSVLHKEIAFAEFPVTCQWCCALPLINVFVLLDDPLIRLDVFSTDSVHENKACVIARDFALY